jgi:ribose/xylose/arabinose/galactoside ABC-type transport system permease subunit
MRIRLAEAPASALVACSLVAIMACALVGTFSGVMVAGFKIPPFVATLAIMQVASGLAFMLGAVLLDMLKRRHWRAVFRKQFQRPVAATRPIEPLS